MHGAINDIIALQLDGCNYTLHVPGFQYSVNVVIVFTNLSRSSQKIFYHQTWKRCHFVTLGNSVMKCHSAALCNSVTLCHPQWLCNSVTHV